MTRVLVLDGQQRSALAITRSLGRYGLDVHVADAVAGLAGSSRYASSTLRYPEPKTEGAAFIAWLHETVSRLRIDLIFPATDVTTMLVAPLQGTFGSARILCAPNQAYQRISNKASLLELAKSAGVPVPAGAALTSRADIESHIANSRYPLVLKPALSKVCVGGNIISTSVFVAQSAEEAAAYVRKQSWIGHIPCLLQEYISGYGAGIFTCYANGKSLGWFSHRRIREKPPSGGVSVLSESVKIEESLRSASERLLDSVGWEGLAMVEFKITHDGVPYVMEVNGRPWGSIQLAIDAGMDYPRLLCQSALGQSPAATDSYSVGRRLRWLMGDVDHLLLQFRNPRLSASTKVAVCCGFLATFLDVHCRQEIWRWEDPKPALFEIRQWLRSLR